VASSGATCIREVLGFMIFLTDSPLIGGLSFFPEQAMDDVRLQNIFSGLCKHA